MYVNILYGMRINNNHLVYIFAYIVMFIYQLLILPLFRQEQIPFAVVGSREEIVAGGQRIRARKYPWGVVEGKVILRVHSVCVCVCLCV